MKVSFPLLGFSWYGLSVGTSRCGCGFLSSSLLNNSGCFGLSGLNLTNCTCCGGGGGGGIVGLGGLVRAAGGGLRAGIGGGLALG